MIFKTGDIVLVPFPYTDFQVRKKRPVAIISPNEANKNGDFTAIFITSKIDATPKMGDYKILDWSKAGLPKPSMTRMKFLTISKELILKKIGDLKPNDLKNLCESISLYFIDQKESYLKSADHKD